MYKTILLISSDNRVHDFLDITVRMLYKLNRQLSLITAVNGEEAAEFSKNSDVYMILLDIDSMNDSFSCILAEIRSDKLSCGKKVMAFIKEEDEMLKKKINEFGCDSVMTRAEFEKHIRNILEV